MWVARGQRVEQDLAAQVLDLARKSGVSNRWSELANENLGREFPGEYTLLRQELTQGTQAPLPPPPVDSRSEVTESSAQLPGTSSTIPKARPANSACLA